LLCYVCTTMLWGHEDLALCSSGSSRMKWFEVLVEVYDKSWLNLEMK
jgi:hypothetical protein